MPAIITHHIFGEDASNLLPEGLLTCEEDLLAFLLGNQGPDPFWARIRTLPRRAKTCHVLANAMHSSHIVDTFLVLRDCAAHVRDDDKTIARAFTLGFAAHYVLDRIAHPLIYAQQFALMEANEELADASGEIHALLEAEIDAWMLWQKRQMTVLDVPCSAALASTERINRVIGALLSQVAWQVYGLDLGAAEYDKALADYRLLYKVIDPPAHLAPRLLAHTEKAVRPHSRLLAQSHPIVCGDDCDAANLNHALWRDPVTGERSTASFPDLFHDALLAYLEFSRRVAEGNRDRIAAMVDGSAYGGAFES